MSLTSFQQKKGNLLKSIHQFKQTTYQQKSLENDIQINEEICELNTLNGTGSIRLDKDVAKFSTKKKRGRNGGNRKKVQNFQYDNFYDGVHPKQSMQINGFYV